MKNIFSMVTGRTPAAAFILSFLLPLTVLAADKTPGAPAPFAGNRKIYLNKGSDNGIYINGSTYAYTPGDTLVLRASQNPFAYFSMENIHGQAGKPVVVINEGGQVQISAMAAKNSTFLKITGTGSSNQYGFFLTSPNQTVSAPAFDINERSSDVEVDHADINTHGYGFWVKQEASCPDSLRFPNWRIANISIHDNRITNTGQEGIYAGSTAPNAERTVYCNGANINPIPLRLGNISIYNNIIDHTGRGGIQLSGADYGNNEIYNNTITNCGYGWDPAQGNGIILGGYTTAYVHDNSIDYTYSSGIFSLGAGLVRIENNRVDHSGLLAGNAANGSCNIMVDTRFTSPVTNTLFYVRNNTLGSNTDINVRVYTAYNTFANGNILCGNVTTSGTAAGLTIPSNVNWVGCTGVANLTIANAGIDQTIAIPVNSVVLAGSGTVTNGAISTYAWSQVSGPSQAVFTSATLATTSATGLIQGTYTFRLKVTDNSGASATDDVLITVTAPVASTYLVLPSKIEAEAYVAMSGIQTETTLDAGAGQNVGWQDNTDWMDYNVNVATAGTYTVSFRVATTNTGVQFQLRNSSGTALASVTVPSTGGWQTFQTVTAQVILPAGQQTLRVYTTNAQGSGWNFNWMDFASVATAPALPSITYAAVPGSVEAESYTAMSGIQTENTGDAGGGQDVGWQENNDWMDYAVNVETAGSYTVTFRVATVNTGVQFQLRNASGAALATVTVPNTGWWQTYQDVTATVTLPVGQQTVRIFTTNAQGSGWNFNRMDFAVAATTTPTPPATSTTTHIEAEAYATMSGIQTENTSDAGGGLNVGWQENNDWMDYSVNVATAGTYTVSFRVATLNTGVQFQLRNSSGTSLATVTVPNTGWWQTYQTVTATVTLPAGQQTLRIFTSNAQGSGWNFNWWEMIGPATTTTPPVTTFTQRIEAEAYATMSGIQTENTADAGGGLNVGWQENNDWMDYSVTIPSAGTYTVNFRVATVNTGAQFQLRNSAGTALTTVTVPNTGWWQTYQTVSATVTLPAGLQTLRVFTSNAQGSGWNFNWWEITNSTTRIASVGATEVVGLDATAIEVFPAQVTDRFSLKVDNELTGSMNINVLDAAGAVKKTFTVNKSSTGAVQTYLSISDLTKGQYTIEVKMTGWNQSTHLEKL